MHLRSRLSPLSAVFTMIAVLAATPVRAVDNPILDRFLPADTEVLVRINVEQALDSALVKKLGLDQVRDQLKQIEELDAALKELDFDPFLDVATITFAAPDSNEQDRLLVIVRGKFKLDKFKAKGEDLAKNMGEVVKLHKVADGAGGQVNVYEVRLPEQDQPLFVALPNETTLLVSPGKDYVADAIKRGKAKTPVELKNKSFQALLEKMDPKQTLALAAIGEALAKNPAGEGALNAALAKIDALGGGITLTEDVKLELVVGAKTVQEARELKKTIDNGVTQGLLLVGLLAMKEEKLAPVVDVLKSVRCNAKDKTVTIKAEVSAEVLQAIQKALGGQ